MTGTWAVVELEAVDARTKSGTGYGMRYCWVCRFNRQGEISEVRAYLDTELLDRRMAEASLKDAEDTLGRKICGANIESTSSLTTFSPTSPIVRSDLLCTRQNTDVEHK